MQYFSNDPYGEGFVIHDTRDQARLAAEAAINEARAAAVDEEWQDDPTQICWGEITQRVASIPAPDGFEDYDLEPNVGAVATASTAPRKHEQ